MKLIVKLMNWINSFPNENEDTMDNEHRIMQSLFNGKVSKLTTKQSIDLFETIEKQFDQKIKDRFFEAHEEIDVIQQEIIIIEQYNERKKKKDVQADNTVSN